MDGVAGVGSGRHRKAGGPEIASNEARPASQPFGHGVHPTQTVDHDGTNRGGEVSEF
jgi:hypothetical protein